MAWPRPCPPQCRSAERHVVFSSFPRIPSQGYGCLHQLLVAVGFFLLQPVSYVFPYRRDRLRPTHNTDSPAKNDCIMKEMRLADTTIIGRLAGTTTFFPTLSHLELPISASFIPRSPEAYPIKESASTHLAQREDHYTPQPCVRACTHTDYIGSKLAERGLHAPANLVITIITFTPVTFTI